MATATFEGGFRQPVFGAQASFRAVMEALARPGTIQPLTAEVVPPKGLAAAAGAVLLTLADADTPVWLDPSLRGNTEIAQWIGFHTGAPVLTDRAAADFAVIVKHELPVDLAGFALGSQEYPDRSTTLIFAVDGFDGSRELTLAGPGIKGESKLAPSALPPGFAEGWAANGTLFPRGVDLIFAAPAAVAGLPRTTRIIRAGEV